MPKIEDDYFDVEKYKKELFKALLRDYTQGVLISSRDLNQRPEPIDTKIVDLLAEMSVNLIKGITKEMSKRIAMTIQQGILAGKDNRSIAKDLENIFSDSNPTKFSYEGRLQTIARTERQRALHQGAYDNAIKAGATKKYLSVVEDSRTSCICGDIFSDKYSKENAIPINEEFTGVCNGKTYSAIKPPFHPNCRTRVNYVFE